MNVFFVAEKVTGHDAHANWEGVGGGCYLRDTAAGAFSAALERSICANLKGRERESKDERKRGSEIERGINYSMFHIFWSKIQNQQL